MAAPMSGKLVIPGYAKVTSVATSMPAPAQRMPLRAVTGELMRFSPTMKSTAVTK